MLKAIFRCKAERTTELPDYYLSTRDAPRLHCVSSSYYISFGTANLTAYMLSFDYAKQYPEALANLGQWLAEGKLKRKFHIVEGIEGAPQALPLLYNGGNTGKL